MERWKIELEITFGMQEDETNYSALDRIKKILNRMLKQEAQLNHYHILKQPQTCWEFD